MNDYNIRTTDYPGLISLGVLMGAITVKDNIVTATNGGHWDYIGPIYKPTGATTVVNGVITPVMASVKNLSGVEYVHVNLRTPLSLGQIANDMATAHPEIAAGLANLGSYFVLGSDGNAGAPVSPYRVYL